ncbi:MAG: hypothetical protein V8S58_04315 [Lachnospiraceae bacterium]
MKLKGIWVAIAVICVAGIGITDYSARHLAGSETQYVSGEDAQQGVSGLAEILWSRSGKQQAEKKRREHMRFRSRE